MDEKTQPRMTPEEIPQLVAGARVATADGELDAFMEEVFGPRATNNPVDE